MPYRPTDIWTAQESARCARVAAFVTFHYRPHTAQFLCRLLASLSGFVVQRMHVTIVTNASDPEITTRITNLAHDCLGRKAEYVVVSRPDCDPPQMLTWAHKPLLRAAALNEPIPYSHFIYLEDDLGFTFRNFLYFMQYAEALRDRGLIPGFIRTEFNDLAGALYSADAVEPTPPDKVVVLPDVTFLSPRYPYCASYVMDREMVSEYLASRSFDPEHSKGPPHSWGIQERAAMGLCWESPPAGFAHRYVLPVEGGCHIQPMCQIAHMPANYTNSPTVENLGKLRLERVFA